MIDRTFIVAGDAIFTIATPVGKHYTFRVARVEPKPDSKFSSVAYFVSILTGPDNDQDYTYLGKLNPDTGEVHKTPKTPTNMIGSFPFRLFNRTLTRIWDDDHDAYLRHGYSIHHEGRCARCARRLTTPESIEMGYGPQCAKIMAVSLLAKLMEDNEREKANKK